MLELERLLKYCKATPRFERITSFRSFKSRGQIEDEFGYNQRVVVKAHYTTPDKLKSHVTYMSREGVGVDEKKPELFTAADHLEPVKEPIKGEKRIFRFIVSPENGDRLDNLKDFTRDIMYKAEKHTGKKLTWFACAHHNTEKPHVHIVVRGISGKKELRFDKEFIRNSFRNLCVERTTQELGLRSMQEIRLMREKEITAERFTCLDKQISFLASLSEAGLIKPETNMQKHRLKYLERIGLAVKQGKKYQLASCWDNELKERAIENDIIKRMHRVIKEERKPYFIYKDNMKIKGKVISKDFENEVTMKSYAIIKAKDKYYYIAGKKLSGVQVGENISVDKGQINRDRVAPSCGVER